MREFNPFDPAVLADPMPHYSALRDACPVAHYRGPHLDFYLVNRHRDVQAVLQDSKVWSSRFSNTPNDTPSLAFMADPPEHTAFRGLFNARFLPSALQAHAPMIESITGALLDALPPLGAGDLHHDFAMPLPVQVMAHLIGIPVEGYRDYKAWSDEFMAMTFNEVPAQASKESLARIFGFFDPHIAERRRLLAEGGVTVPGPEHLGTVLPDDLLSLMVVARIADRPLRDIEIKMACMGFLVGGNETTTSLLTNCVLRLLEDRTRWDRLRAEPALIDSAIEESLRFDPPTLAMFRTGLCPAAIQGEALPDHAKLMYSIAGANRDPSMFDQPDEFLLDRPPAELRRHLTFGFGRHACLGANLSRLEARIALRALLERLPGLRLAGPTTRIAPFNFWGRSSMPVAWK